MTSEQKSDAMREFCGAGRIPLRFTSAPSVNCEQRTGSSLVRIYEWSSVVLDAIEKTRMGSCKCRTNWHRVDGKEPGSREGNTPAVLYNARMSHSSLGGHSRVGYAPKVYLCHAELDLEIGKDWKTCAIGERKRAFGVEKRLKLRKKEKINAPI